METVDQGDSGLFCDFGLYVPTDWSGSEHAKILTFAPAVLVSLDGSHKEIESVWEERYFSSEVRVAIS
jgi:hypothetical protein